MRPESHTTCLRASRRTGLREQAVARVVFVAGYEDIEMSVEESSAGVGRLDCRCRSGVFAVLNIPMWERTRRDPEEDMNTPLLQSMRQRASRVAHVGTEIALVDGAWENGAWRSSRQDCRRLVSNAHRIGQLLLCP